LATLSCSPTDRHMGTKIQHQVMNERSLEKRRPLRDNYLLRWGSSKRSTSRSLKVLSEPDSPLPAQLTSSDNKPGLRSPPLLQITGCSQMTLYKINFQANANAKRTVLLLVLLLSSYVLCWAPYNIYTWRNAYRLVNTVADHKRSTSFPNVDFNRTLTPALIQHFHTDLKRIIFVNYTLYLLSMISTCFSFIFYFALNKQARRELTRLMGCVCPCWISTHRHERKAPPPNLNQLRMRPFHSTTKEEPKYKIIFPISNLNTPKHRSNINDGSMKRKSNRSAPVKYTNSFNMNRGLTILSEPLPAKHTLFAYGCHIECCW
jgi:hypothetical protein